MTDHRDEHEITPLPAEASDWKRNIDWKRLGDLCDMFCAITKIQQLEEETQRLRRQCDMEAAHIAELKEQIKTLRAERDEARREVCSLEADTAEDQREFARQRGWDCFRDTTEPPLVSDESAGRLE